MAEERSLSSNETTEGIVGINMLKRLEKQNQDLFALACDVILDGWDFSGERADITPVMIAAALEKEAIPQDACVAEGTSAKSYPPRLRRLAADILSIEAVRLRDEAPASELSFDDVIDRISAALGHTGGDQLATIHNDLCDDQKPVRYLGDSLFEEAAG